MAGLGLATLLSVALGIALLYVCERGAANFRNSATRLSLLALSRLRASSLLLWTTFTLGALLMALMPLIEKSLRIQLSDPRSAGPVPSLFLFDIQEEQLEGVVAWAKKSDTELQFVTPLIRGRLLKINDEPFEKLADAPTTREEEREARFRNRGFNLTYRNALTPSERLIQGTGFEGLGVREAHAPEAVTVEKRFAERLKMKLGDLLTFDIQGVPISARVTGIRQVQWTSFQPNFFIVFEPRALVDAPKTYLASLPSMDPQKREKLQRSLFESFSNVSTIDVTRVMETLLEGFSQISQALALMALLSTLAGGVAVLSIARLRTEERLGELQLLKLLGMKKAALLAAVTTEMAFISGMAALTGLILATSLAGMLSRWIFDSPVLLPTPALGVGIIAAFLGLGGLLGWLASRRAVSEPPQSWLKTLSQET
jgi:putative ABC transport system permease protein